LSEHEIADALAAGAGCARHLLANGLIDGAALRLQGKTVVVALKALDTTALLPVSRHRPMERVLHA
jgi:hypothetical protein